MYTVSLRPYESSMITKLCSNFEQESCEWKMSTFSECVEAEDTNLGVQLYTPLGNLDITPKQVASALSGLSAAYKELVERVYKEAYTYISTTPFRTMERFIECIPKGLFRQDTPRQSEATYTNYPILHRVEDDAYFAFTDWAWVQIVGVDASAYETMEGTTGMQVLYNDDMVTLKDVGIFLRMLGGALDSFEDIDTEEKLYTANLNSVR